MSRTSIRTEQDIEHIVLDACLYGKDYAARTHGLGMSTVYAYMQRYPEYTPLSRTQMERHARDEQAFFGSTKYIDPLQRHAYVAAPAHTEPTLQERIAHVQAKLTAQLAQR